MSALFIIGTVVCTVYGQLIIKREIDREPDLPGGMAMFWTLAKLIVTNPLVLSGFAAAGAASLFWMAALSRLDLSYAYPVLALNFVAVVALSFILFGEELNAGRIGGLALIVIGVLWVAAGG